MNPDKRKSMVKRLRFWHGVLLLVVVGIGVLGYVTYRKAMGPPPTPPGKCPEFDKHLAEIDKDWLFVFAQDGRVIVTDIYGENDTELAVPKTDASAGILDPIIGISSNPEGKWAALYCAYEGPNYASDVLLGLVDLRNLTMKVITSEGIGNPAVRSLPVWLSDRTFILPLPLHQFESGHTPCRVYDLGDLEHPKTVELPVDSRWFAWPVNDTVSHALLFLNEPDDSGKMKVNAYDKNGLRDVTKEEEERFYLLAGADYGFLRGRGGDVPAFETKGLERSPWLDWLDARLGKPKVSRTEILLNGKQVRVGVGHYGTLGAIQSLRWDLDMRIFSWWEYRTKDHIDSYYMDEKGHYRFWHPGRYWSKIPRWKGESEEAGE